MLPSPWDWLRSRKRAKLRLTRYNKQHPIHLQLVLLIYIYIYILCMHTPIPKQAAQFNWPAMFALQPKRECSARRAGTRAISVAAFPCRAFQRRIATSRRRLGVAQPGNRFVARVLLCVRPVTKWMPRKKKWSRYSLVKISVELSDTFFCMWFIWLMVR